jgi:histidinol dehydrogenase
MMLGGCGNALHLRAAFHGMKILSHTDPTFARFVSGLNRRALPEPGVRELVADVIAHVATRGDVALVEFTQRFDGAALTPKTLFVSDAEWTAAEESVSAKTKSAIARSLRNIHAFAKKSLRKDWVARNAEGAVVGERFTPFDRVGVYVPGGKAPLVSTALMTAGFAQAAGVPEIIAATPCGPDGKVNPALLYALRAAGVTEAIKVGGAQAVAAMALGTKTIRPVDRLVGPGNRFVVEAKRQLLGAVSIDLLPGPSEILILSDKTGDDMLAQAEHGGDSIVGFMTDSKALLKKVEGAIKTQLVTLSRSKIIREVLKRGTFLLHVKSFASGIEISNAFAPEHLLLITADEERWLPQVKTAGAIYRATRCRQEEAAGRFPGCAPTSSSGGRAWCGWTKRLLGNRCRWSRSSLRWKVSTPTADPRRSAWKNERAAGHAEGIGAACGRPARRLSLLPDSS